MEPAQIKQLLLSRLADCDVEVSGDGRHFDIVVVGDIFSGLSPVKKQQVVYGALQAEIADGSIHAVNMKTLTRAEWQKSQG
jgi:acid stress-induced BolA-like protein IbaG/YrbA